MSTETLTCPGIGTVASGVTVGKTAAWTTCPVCDTGVQATLDTKRHAYVIEAHTGTPVAPAPVESVAPTQTVTFDFTGVELPDTDTEYMTSEGFVMSPQQRAVMEWISNGSGNGMIVAVAGSGKTSTLLDGLGRMKGRVAFAAYNKKIADEIAGKVRARGTDAFVSVKTFHAFAFAAWRKRYPRVQVDGDKSFNLIQNELENMPKPMRQFAIKLVSMLKQSGIGFVFPGDDLEEWNRIIYHYGLDDELTGRKPWEDKDDFDTDEMDSLLEQGRFWAGKLLNLSIERSNEVIDFDDMIFMPLYAGMDFDQYDWVLVDEAQDTNAARLALARKMVKPGGRLLAVGDPRQAIYGFSGADASSLKNIVENFGCAEMGLTVSYRCPQNVVRHAQQWSREIEAAANAPDGVVSFVDYEDFAEDLRRLTAEARQESVILCRNNKPIVALAFELIRQRIPCHVEGRDIGAQIRNLANKWRIDSLSVLRDKVAEYERKAVADLIKAKKQAKADVTSDRCQTLIVLIEGILMYNPQATKADLNREIDGMFADDSNRGITLSSIHKSKGREWPTVYWLGRNAYQPSRFASQDWQHEQELNLMYVAATRAQRHLIEVIVPEQRGMSEPA